MYVRIGTLLKINKCQMALELTHSSGLVVPGTRLSYAKVMCILLA